MHAWMRLLMPLSFPSAVKCRHPTFADPDQPTQLQAPPPRTPTVPYRHASHTQWVSGLGRFFRDPRPLDLRGLPASPDPNALPHAGEPDTRIGVYSFVGHILCVNSPMCTFLFRICAFLVQTLAHCWCSLASGDDAAGGQPLDDPGTRGRCVEAIGAVMTTHSHTHKHTLSL